MTIKRLIILLATLLVAVSLSAQERVIREFYTNSEAKAANVVEEAPAKRVRQPRAERPRQERVITVNPNVSPDHRQGASPIIAEGAIFFSGLFSDDSASSISVEALLHKRLYLIDNAYVSAGGGVAWSTTTLSSDSSSWGLAAEIPLMAGVNLFNDWVELQVGPCFAYTFMGGVTMYGEKYSLSDFEDAKRTAFTFDIRLSLGGGLGVKFKLNSDVEAIGFTVAF